MKVFYILFIFSFILLNGCEPTRSQETRDVIAVERQQSQYAKGQPVPTFNWSLERHLVSQLYQIRNQKVATHAVWRSNYGIIEGDCPCMGFGIPYDTSLTNPLRSTDEDQYGFDKSSLTTVEQAEPNGIFASKNTSATWVMCTGEAGLIEPIYIETKVTIYPYPVSVDYVNNTVTKAGAATVTITKGN